MSAKHSKKSAGKAAPAPMAVPTPEAAISASGAATAGAAAGAAQTSWLDSPDPKKRMWGKIIFIAVWIYVAALWLLALDQTFHWGIFGPKVRRCRKIRSRRPRARSHSLQYRRRDAALLVTLAPGNYTAQASGMNNTGGQAIVEVYEVP